MIKTYQRKSQVKAVQVLDTPECLEAISSLVKHDVRISYVDPMNPVLKINGSGETANVGDMIINDAGEIYIMPHAEFVKIFMPCDTPAERMVIEIEELVERFHKLEAFMNTEKFLSLPSETVGLLEAQYGAMLALSHVLQLRLLKMEK